VLATLNPSSYDKQQLADFELVLSWSSSLRMRGRKELGFTEQINYLSRLPVLGVNAD
jgi:hypothetical protein